MKKPSHLVLLLSIGTLLSFSSCNSPSATSGQAIQATPGALAAELKTETTAKESTPSPASVASFAHSIETLNFTYDPTSQLADLDFEYDTGAKSSVGYPVVDDIQLRGKAVKGESASLESDQASDFSAKVLCSDETCSYSQIELTGKNSETLKINATTLTQAQSALAYGTIPDDPATVMDALAKGLSGVEQRDVSLSIREIVGGTTYFEMRFNLGKNQGIASGTVGTGVNVQLAYYTEQGNSMVGGSGPFAADVTYDPSRSFIGIKFKEPGAILSIGSGAELFSSIALQ